MSCTQISAVRSGSSTDSLVMHGTSRFDIPSISTSVCYSGHFHDSHSDSFEIFTEVLERILLHNWIVRFIVHFSLDLFLAKCRCHAVEPALQNSGD